MAEQEGITIIQELYTGPRLARNDIELHIGSGVRIRGGVSIEHLDRGTDLSGVQLRVSQQKPGHTLVLGELRIDPNFMEIYALNRTRGLTSTLQDKPIRRIPLESTLPNDDISRHRGILLVHFSEKYLQEFGYSYYYLLASSLPEARRSRISPGLLARRRYSVEEN